ncbi:hypothetical protein ES703_104183 [subsurface metagenome]
MVRARARAPRTMKVKTEGDEKMIGKPKRDESGRIMKGNIPPNKIFLPEKELRELYEKLGSTMIARHFGVSKQTVLRNLHEYKIEIKSPPLHLPEYWKASLRVPKSKPVWSKGLTKETDERIKRISEILLNRGRQRRLLRNIEIGYCACGCGEKIHKYDSRGRLRYYKKGHSKLGQFKKGQIPWNKGKKRDSKVVHRMLTIRSPNKQEKYLTALFEEHNLPYHFVGNGKVIIEGKCPDFINYNGLKKIIEFFGEYWHKPEDEFIKREFYARYGYEMLDIWGKELRDEQTLLIKIFEFDEGETFG